MYGHDALMYLAKYTWKGKMLDNLQIECYDHLLWNVSKKIELQKIFAVK